MIQAALHRCQGTGLTSICTCDPEAGVSIQHIAQDCQAAKEHAAVGNESRSRPTMRGIAELHTRKSQLVSLCTTSNTVPRVRVAWQRTTHCLQTSRQGQHIQKNSSPIAHAEAVRQRKQQWQQDKYFSPCANADFMQPCSSPGGGHQ